MPQNKQKASKGQGRKQGQAAGKQSGKTTANNCRDSFVPAAMNSVAVTSKPLVMRGKNGTVVRHRELLDNIVGSANFAVAAYSLNPGLLDTFPWLHNIAKSYEKYRVRKFAVELKTNTGSQSPGTYGVAIDFNSADSIPNTEQQIMAYTGSQNSAVWNSCTLMVDKLNKDSAYRELFVRTGALPESADIKTYDLGLLLVYTTGATDDALLGKIYLNYEIEFFTPQLGLFNDVAAGSLSFQAVSPLRAAPFGTNGSPPEPIEVGGLQAVFLDGSSLSLPAGSYLMAYEVVGTAFSPTLSPVVTFTPSNGGQIIGGASQGVGSAGTRGIGWSIFEVFNSLTVIDWDFAPSMGSLSSAFFNIASFSTTDGLSKGVGRMSLKEATRSTVRRKIDTYQKSVRVSGVRGPEKDPAVDPKISTGCDRPEGFPREIPNYQAMMEAYKKHLETAPRIVTTS